MKEIVYRIVAKAAETSNSYFFGLNPLKFLDPDLE